MIKIDRMVKPELLKQGAVIAGLATTALTLINSSKETPKTNMLDYMDKSPATLSNKVLPEKSNPLSGKEFPADFFENLLKNRETKLSCDEGEDFDYMNYEGCECITDVGVFKESLKKFKNPKIKEVLTWLFNNNKLYDNTMEILYDIEVKSQNIEDEKVLSELDNIYKKIVDLQVEDDDFSESTLESDFLIHEAYQIVEAYNTIKGIYVQYKTIPYFTSMIEKEEEPSKTQEYLETRDIDMMIDDDEDEDFEVKTDLREELKKQIYNGEKVNSSEVEDFIWAQKCEAFEVLRTNAELKQHLYGILLKELGLPTNVEKQCQEILEEFGVMLIPSQKTGNLLSEVEAVKEELKAWTEVSNGEAKFPRVISLNSIKKEFLFDTAGEYCQMQDMIALKDGYLDTITYALRHEIMHRNDLLKDKFNFIGEDLVRLLDEIMPIKMEGKYKKRDYDKCKYREEFLKAGVNAGHIGYAYTNRAEFIAVAAEGDVSRYSPEFKEVLLKLGMPEYALNLKTKNPSVIKNCRIYDEVKAENPDVNDYKELAYLHFQKRNQIMEKGKSNLLKAIFEAMNDCD